MADIPYAAWFAYIRRFLRAHMPLLELFSGPAPMAGLARAEGFAAFALDNHFPFMKNKGGYHLVADARAIPLREASLGTLVATNCGLNYLRAPGELKAHFQECFRILANGGCYVFDTCPEERAIALNKTTQKAVAGKVSFAHRYQSASRVLETTVLIQAEAEVTETHRQYIFSDDEITSAAAAAGFTIAERIDNYALPAAGSLTPVVTWVLSAGKAGAK